MGLPPHLKNEDNTEFVDNAHWGQGPYHSFYIPRFAMPGIKWPLNKSLPKLWKNKTKPKKTQKLITSHN